MKAWLAGAGMALAGLGVGVWRTHLDAERRQLEADAEVQAWDAAQEAWDAGRRPAEPLRYPPTDPRRGRALLAEVGLEGWLPYAGGREALVVSYGDEDLQGEAPLILAASTASLLGFPPAEDARWHARHALAAQEGLRRRYAPELPAQAFPDLALDGGSSVMSAERLLRSSLPGDVEDPVAQVVVTVRSGGLPEPSAWEQPGVCGMAALELGRRGRVEDLAQLLQVAVEGPTASDRLAALYAARRLAPVEQWPEGEAKERAVRLEAAPPTPRRP